MRPMSDRRALLAQRVGADPAVLFAFVFGSRARRAAGTVRADSDWDVGVFLREDLDASGRFDVRLRLLATLAPELDVDLVVLNDAPALLAHRALQGEPLLIRDRSAYVRFFVRTLARAGDERYWRDLHRRERTRRLEEHRFGRP
jgi:predicted nucleotidyltransferase